MKTGSISLNFNHYSNDNPRVTLKSGAGSTLAHDPLTTCTCNAASDAVATLANLRCRVATTTGIWRNNFHLIIAPLWNKKYNAIFFKPKSFEINKLF